MRLERLIHVVQILDVFRVINVLDVEVLLDLLNSRLIERNAMRLLIDRVIFIALEKRHEPIDFSIQVQILLQLPRYDERRPRLVDQNRVNLVDNRIMMTPLHILRQLILHIIAQIIETKLVIRTIRNVAKIRRTTLVVVQVRQYLPYRKTQKLVNLTHPIRVTARQIIVHRHQMRTLALQRIQIHRTSRHERLPLARLHLRYHPTMKHDPTDELHIVMAHVQHATTRLSHRRKRLRQQLIQRRPLAQLLLKLRRLRSQFVIAQRTYRRLQLVDLHHHWPQLAHHALMTRPKYPLYKIQHHYAPNKSHPCDIPKQGRKPAHL